MATTPPPFASPQRFSSHLSFIGFAQSQSSSNLSQLHEREPVPRIRSQISSMNAGVSEAARSSYLTSDTSRMSGLSDFPVPPMDGHTVSSVLDTYFDGSHLSTSDGSFDLSLLPDPAAPLTHAPLLSREPSNRTFGGEPDEVMGEAL